MVTPFMHDMHSMASKTEALALEAMLPSTLEPFYYQVGGHFLLMKMGAGCVCKPRGKRESHFYETVPKLMEDFVPKYYGVVSVSTEYERAEGLKDSIIHRACSTIAVTTTDEALSCIDKDREIFRPLHKASEIKTLTTQEQPFVPNSSSVFHNPWTDSRLHALNIALKDSHITHQDYIVLEDITSHFKCPCITDLKLGTRCHSDLSTPDKIKRHISREGKNSSATLGVRCAGMLVYDNTKQCYRFNNRQIGQWFSKDEFLEHFKYFLRREDKDYRLDVIEELITKLKNLKEVIKQLDTYRFFSCSLLIAYEGLQTQGQNGSSDSKIPSLLSSSSVEVKMIDFEKTTHSNYTCDPVQYQGPDEGVLVGLTTLIYILESLERNEDL